MTRMIRTEMSIMTRAGNRSRVRTIRCVHVMIVIALDSLSLTLPLSLTLSQSLAMTMSLTMALSLAMTLSLTMSSYSCSKGRAIAR